MAKFLTKYKIFRRKMFDLINKALIAIENAGLTDFFYGIWLYVIIASIFIWCFWFSRKMGMKTSKAIILGVITYASLYAWMVIYAWIENGFRFGGAMNNIYTFLFIPIFLLLFAKMLKIEWRDACYIIAPFMPLQQALAMCECTFGGCCRGYPSSWGLYSIRWNYYYFPIQQINTLYNFAVFIFLVIHAKRNGYKSDPYQYPLMLILVGAPRFFIEFLHDNEKVLLGCSNHGLHALLMAIVGAVAIIIIKNREKKATT